MYSLLNLYLKNKTDIFCFFQDNTKTESQNGWMHPGLSRNFGNKCSTVQIFGQKAQSFSGRIQSGLFILQLSPINFINLAFKKYLSSMYPCLSAPHSLPFCTLRPQSQMSSRLNLLSKVSFVAEWQRFMFASLIRILTCSYLSSFSLLMVEKTLTQNSTENIKSADMLARSLLQGFLTRSVDNL